MAGTEVGSVKTLAQRSRAIGSTTRPTGVEFRVTQQSV